MFGMMKCLEAANELLKDKQELRECGLTKEEVAGYEEFFFAHYFPTVVEEV